MESYYINTSKHFSEEVLLHCWNVIIPWLMERSKRYKIKCNPVKKGASKIISQLTEHSEYIEEKERRFNFKLINYIFSLTSKSYLIPDKIFQGISNKIILDILLQGPSSDTSVAADIAPCEEITLLRNEEILFTSFDYGRFQILYITNDEAEELKDRLEYSGISKNILIEQKNTDDSNKSHWIFIGKKDKD